MSKFCGGKEVASILAAANHWKNAALLQGGSVFGGDGIWNADNFEKLRKAFVDNPDTSDRSFQQKLADQIGGATEAVKQLGAELMWLLLLCPSNISVEKKRETVQNILALGDLHPPQLEQWLAQPILVGIGSAGPGFNNHRPREVTFCINAIQSLFEENSEQRTSILNDPWVCAEWLQQVPDAQYRQFRHMLLYLLFPDYFERIFSAGDRKSVLQAFSNLTRPQVNKLTAFEIDKRLYAIRTDLEQEHGTKELDFYNSPLTERWHPSIAASGEMLTVEHVNAALAEIDQAGIPQQAKATRYDLISGQKRYPPKLVFSTAVRIATGNILEHGDFGAGDDGPAFQALRNLGFAIVPKNLIAETVSTFLDQANKGEDLRTSDYPDEYRDLKLKVGFGQGTFSRVPWIAFLGGDQKVSQGIYPVLLYYREPRLLILAYGISETNAPELSWTNLSGLQTVREYQTEKHGREPERYGDSIVAAAYEVPDGLNLDDLTLKLDEMVEKYLDILGQERPNSASAINSTESPYSLSDALADLFVEEDYCELLLHQLDKNKNLILQGPPGVGKTFFADRLASAFVESTGSERVKAIQFHASYSYEDFVQGYRPNGKGGFERKDGVFLRFCKKALADPGRKYVFIIDEINRANLSKVFGECLMLIEADKRQEKYALDLTYAADGDKPFHVPANLHIVGLMNTADRSLALVDYALRRRFDFFDIRPGFEADQFEKYLTRRNVPTALIEHIKASILALNQEIASDGDLGKGFEIGHSYFCNLRADEDADEDFRTIIEHKISPLLREYWYEGERAEGWRRRLLRI